MTLLDADFLRSLSLFVNEWPLLRRDNDALSAQLNQFTQDWQDATKNFVDESSLPSAELDSVLLKNFIITMSPLIDAVLAERRNGETTNIWEISGLKRDEVRICSALAWFLNYYGEHGQKGGLLARILKSVKGLPEDFPLPEYMCMVPYWVNVESCPSGDKCSRVDIEIEGENFLLFIEVKIDASETNNQLDRYLEIGEKKSGSRPWGVLFLTPAGSKPNKAANAKNNSRLIPVSWSIFSKAFTEHAKSLPFSFSKSIVDQFANYISKF